MIQRIANINAVSRCHSLLASDKMILLSSERESQTQLTFSRACA